MYAVAPYTLIEASVNKCNSTFSVSVDWKLTNLGTANDGKFTAEFFLKFHWSIKSLGNSLSHPKLLLLISWIKSFAFTLIGEINPVRLNVELTILCIPLLVSGIFLLTTLKVNISELRSQNTPKALSIGSSSRPKFKILGDKLMGRFHDYWK